jgi:hypothetical protein
VLIREMDPNRPDIAQQVSDQALDSGTGSNSNSVQKSGTRATLPARLNELQFEQESSDDEEKERSYRRKKKRWSTGGFKRSHSQSLEGEDTMPELRNEEAVWSTPDGAHIAPSNAQSERRQKDVREGSMHTTSVVMDGPDYWQDFQPYEDNTVNRYFGKDSAEFKNDAGQVLSEGVSRSMEKHLYNDDNVDLPLIIAANRTEGSMFTPGDLPLAKFEGSTKDDQQSITWDRTRTIHHHQTKITQHRAEEHIVTVSDAPPEAGENGSEGFDIVAKGSHVGIDSNQLSLLKLESHSKVGYQPFNTLESMDEGADNNGARLKNEHHPHFVRSHFVDGEDGSSFRDSAYGTLSETASVQGIISLPGVREEMLDILINDEPLRIFADDVLQALDTDAFVSVFKPLLQTFARQLRQEAEAKDQKGAAYVFWYNAAYAARCACEYWSGVENSRMTQLLAQLPEKKMQLDHVLQQIAPRTAPEDAADYDADAGNEWEDQDPEELRGLHLKRLEAFITSSSAFQNLRESLRDWARSSTSTKGTNLDYDIYTTKPLISTARDYCKRVVEHVAGTKLSWWPLSQPEEALEPDYTRVYSQPFCIGSGRRSRCFYDDIPTSLAEKFFPDLTVMRDATRNWYWKAVNRRAVLLKGTTLMRVLCEASGKLIIPRGLDRRLII